MHTRLKDARRVSLILDVKVVRMRGAAVHGSV
jgi:hypothetical protein